MIDLISLLLLAPPYNGAGVIVVSFVPGNKPVWIVPAANTFAVLFVVQK